MLVDHAIIDYKWDKLLTQEFTKEILYIAMLQYGVIVIAMFYVCVMYALLFVLLSLNLN